MSRRPTAPIPEHLVERFFSYAWQIAEGGFPLDDWDRVATRRERQPTYAQRHAIAALWSVSAALRFSELRRLRLQDVSAEGLSAWIQRSKRGLDGLVQISPRLIAVTKEWRANWSGADHSPLLIPTRTGGPLTNNSFNRDCCLMFGKLLGIRITSHSFRDTACHLAVAQGCSVYAIQMFMGHRSAITTEVYLRKREASSLRLHAVDREYVSVRDLVA